jgi:hypothetical protein
VVSTLCRWASKEDGADWDGGLGDSAAECGEAGGRGESSGTVCAAGVEACRGPWLMFGVGVLRGDGHASSQGRGSGYGIAGLLQACMWMAMPWASWLIPNQKGSRRLTGGV